MDWTKFAEYLVDHYGGSGAIIGVLLYAFRTVWKDNVDLRARLDRAYDRTYTVSVLSAGLKPKALLEADSETRHD